LGIDRQIARGSRDGLVAGAVVVGRAFGAALVKAGTDVLGRFGIHDGLEHPAEQPAHELTTIGGAEHLDHLEQGRIV